jgi:sugar phosphate isomerase/epimerase
MDRLGLDMQTVFGLPPVEHVALAAQLGCSHISIGLAPVPWKLDEFAAWSLKDDAVLRRETRTAMSDLGVTCSVIEGFAVRPQVDARDRAADLDIAAELGAARVSAVCMEPDLARGLDQLAILADLTAERGLILTLEFAPPHRINTLQGAIEAIRQIGRPNMRLVIDAMHFFRSGGVVADLERMDPALIGYAQLCDVPQVSAGGTYLDEACFNRQPPGQGALPLREWLRATPNDIPLGLEVPMRAEVERTGLASTVRRIVAAGRDLLAQAAP